MGRPPETGTPKPAFAASSTLESATDFSEDSGFDSRLAAKKQEVLRDSGKEVGAGGNQLRATAGKRAGNPRPVYTVGY